MGGALGSLTRGVSPSDDVEKTQYELAESVRRLNERFRARSGRPDAETNETSRPPAPSKALVSGCGPPTRGKGAKAHSGHDQMRPSPPRRSPPQRRGHF
ncbi:hypothetical protein MRX96_036943 [Rhipicephalus microplus]